MFKADSEQVLQPRPASSVGVAWSSIDDIVSVALTSPPALMTDPAWANYKPVTVQPLHGPWSKSPPWEAKAPPPVLPKLPPSIARSPKAELQVLPKSPPWKAKAPHPATHVLPAAGMVSKPPILFLPPGAPPSSRDAMPAASSGDAMPASSGAMPASSGASSGKPFDRVSQVVGYVPVHRDPHYGLWVQDKVLDENAEKVSLRPMVKNIEGM